jgi:hypothetical protein
MVQEFLPEIKYGDKRLIYVCGKIFEYCVSKVATNDDFKFNEHNASTLKFAQLSEEERKIEAIVKDKFNADGIYFAGLDVIAYKSGTIDTNHRISKKGSSYIRAALYLPSITASMHNPQMKVLYDRIASKNTKTKMIAITAVMRKLLLLIFTLWKSGEEYDSKRSVSCTDVVTLSLDQMYKDEPGATLKESALV